MRIVIFGGNGFIGRHLAAELARRGHSLALPVRDRERAKNDLILLPKADVFACDPTQPVAAKKALQGADVAINLVGVLNENKKSLFARIHGEFARVLAESCKAQKVPHFVQISAIGAADNAPSAYLRSKAKAEQIIRGEESFRTAIVRLSVVFGEGDNFVNQFASLLRLAPAMPLPCATALMQPIAVADAVSLIIRAAENEALDKTIWHAGGPEVLTLADIVARVAAALGMRRKILPLGPALSFAAAAVAETIPFVNILTRDNCRSASLPSVCPKNGNDAQKQLGELTDLAAGLARMFPPDSPFYGHRAAARR